MNRSEFLSGTLMTPRAEIAAQSTLPINREPLLTSQALNTEIASYNTTEKTYDDRITAALGIAGIVRNSLRYKTFAKEKTLLSPESIAESEETNCYGYTIVLSECLSQAKIKHYIGFANGHTFVLLGEKASGRFTMIDPVTRKYNGEITSALKGKSIYDQLQSDAPFAVTELHTDEMLRLRGLNSKTSELSLKNRWISHENPNNPYRQRREGQSELDYTLQLQVFNAGHGRELLTHYANAVIYLNNKDSDGMTDELTMIDGAYPDMDPRNRFELARNARTLAIEKGKWGNAMTIADIIEHSIDESNSATARYFRPDTLRKIGNCTGISDLLGHAVTEYQAIPHSSNVTKGKIRAAQTQYVRVREADKS